MDLATSLRAQIPSLTTTLGNMPNAATPMAYPIISADTVTAQPIPGYFWYLPFLTSISVVCIDLATSLSAQIPSLTTTLGSMPNAATPIAYPIISADIVTAHPIPGYFSYLPLLTSVSANTMDLATSLIA